MELKRVVITGIGAISPLGATARETWEAVVAGKSGAGPITLFDASKFKTTFACEVKEFDVSKYIDKKEARRLDRYAQFAMVAAEECIADSKIDVETIRTVSGSSSPPVSVVWVPSKKRCVATTQSQALASIPSSSLR